MTINSCHASFGYVMSGLQVNIFDIASLVCAKIFLVILLMTERIRNICNQIEFFIVSNLAKLARDSANKS